MSAYIYAAAMYCEACGEELCNTLPKPANLDERTYDSGDYPKGPYANGGGESDCPEHCANCHCCLNNELTEAGVQYVIETLDQAMVRGATTDVERGWAAQLRDYYLSNEQQLTLDCYLECFASCSK